MKGALNKSAVKCCPKPPEMNPLVPHVVLAAAMCIMASNHVVAFIALDGNLFTPMQFCLLRYLVTTPVLLALHAPHIRDPKIEIAPFKDIMTQAVLMFAANHS